MERNKITAEEYLQSNNAFESLDTTPYRKLIVSIASIYMIEFAKIKVTEALKEAAENVLLELNESNTGRLEWVVDKQSILNSYDLNQIK